MGSGPCGIVGHRPGLGKALRQTSAGAPRKAAARAGGIGSPGACADRLIHSTGCWRRRARSLGPASLPRLAPHRRSSRNLRGLARELTWALLIEARDTVEYGDTSSFLEHWVGAWGQPREWRFKLLLAFSGWAYATADASRAGPGHPVCAGCILLSAILFLSKIPNLARNLCVSD